MNKKSHTLNNLPINHCGFIKEITCENNIKRRLLDLGLIRGTKICPILVSPFKDPRAFLFRGSIIAIRSEDAKKIEVYCNDFNENT
ncbi:MAG: ferrous iron transport protein A [Clostridia bacterium]|nr:ferrous iron transport protein A [Clostridia bacterium]